MPSPRLDPIGRSPFPKGAKVVFSSEPSQDHLTDRLRICRDIKDELSEWDGTQSDIHFQRVVILLHALCFRTHGGINRANIKFAKDNFNLDIQPGNVDATGWLTGVLTVHKGTIIF